ncbi:MAG: bifunctional glutamate N-acetyltransferase/amino-acid acetyltransferase ArgJ [Candidatus Omnitrophica bacterium]|nr:bifunctional glutamate N-acetyltransferase/amino-acid acetyltransferase ArgJ [Candidatus Omnitrophota bacterium]
MKNLSSGITAPKGFKANGLACGIKKSGKLDLALFYSTNCATAAAVFTKNSVKAAPLIISQRHIRNHKIQAVVINSGNANCFTGDFGLKYAERTTDIIGSLLNIPKTNVFVLSTGIIGKPLPITNIEKASPKLIEGLSAKNGKKAAEAILTTDITLKEKALSITIGDTTVNIGGCCKGSGMIAPNMATMLGVITTDAAISAKMLNKALKEAVMHSFNSISVDGCMSTNDTVIILANGQAGNKTITEDNNHFKIFLEALKLLCLDLAKKIVLDGEGATKFIEIKVTGASSKSDAHKLAMAVANSNLVKTASYGKNANWGRVAAALGSLGIKTITEENLKIQFDADKNHVLIEVILNLGHGQATAYTCDLTKEYIQINNEYN